MAGFNFTPPPGPLPPMANLAQLAQASFRPPAMMNMPTGLSAMPVLQQAPGFNVAAGMDALGAGVIAALKGMSDPAVAEQRAAPGFGTLDPTTMPSTSSIDRRLDPSLGSQDALGGPPPDFPAAAGGDGPFSFLGGIADFLRRWSSGGGSNV
jgi:hypothetical protein